MVIAEPTTSNGSQMVNHIQQLQETEKQAFRELENRTGAVTLTPEEKSAIITKINDLSATRETLYDSLHENHDFYSKNLTSAQHTLVQQTDALEVVERELNRTKRRVELINEERINRLRLVEINRYYGAKYKHHTSILKNVTLMFAVLLVIVMMNNRLLSHHKVDPRTIYAVTFTNKAAREMKQRVGELLDPSACKGLTVCTFHRLGMTLLKEEVAASGRSANFSIFDLRMHSLSLC